MKQLFLLLVLSIHCQASVTIKPDLKVSATQALFQVVAPTADSCTYEISESASYTPLVPDVDPAIFTNANTEATHLVISWVSGTDTVRLVRFGLRTSAFSLTSRWISRALSADTDHYVRATCNAVTATTTFHTGVPRGIAPEALPTDASGFGQLAYPEFDFTDWTKPVVDPRTGLKIYAADPAGRSSTQNLTIPANNYTGGSGWTSLSNVTGYGTTVATTGNTNTLTVYLNTSAYAASGINGGDQGGLWPFDNFVDAGIDLYGSGTDATASNRTIRGCLSLDSGQTCYTSYASVALAQTTNAAAGPLPSTYPAAYFRGWSKPLPRNAWPKCGSVTVTAGAVVLTKDCSGNAIGAYSISGGSYFNQDWATGTKILITGSSGSCTNSFCTIASVTDATHLTLSENFTLAENTYRSAALAVILNKTNATGTINVSARWKLAKGFAHNIWTGGCSTVTVTSGDGITGWPCIFPLVRQSYGGLFLVGQNGVIRFISPFANNGCSNVDPNDCPVGAQQLLGRQLPTFDPSDPTKMYIHQPTQGGKVGLFKAQYSGTWAAYAQYNSTTLTSPVTAELTWTNLTPGASDLRTQILANTTYNETYWPVLTGSQILSAGIVGGYSLLYASAVSQNYGCWVFAFNNTTGAFYKAWNTTADGTISALHYAGCHSVVAIDQSSATNGLTFIITNDNLTWGSGVSGGPYAGTITTVKKAGVFSADTSLSSTTFPDPATTTTCPGGLPQWMIDRGVIDGQCIQVQGTQPCYAAAGASEAAANPCPWNAARGYLGTLRLGDFLKDPAASGGYDSEGFMVVQLTDTGSGTFTAYLQRNANFSYCAYGTSASVPPKDGAASLAQVAHSNGWAYSAVPQDACSFNQIVIDMVNNTYQAFNFNATGGHFATYASSPGKLTLIGGGTDTTYPIQTDRALASIQAVSDFKIPQAPSFATYSGNNATQSYVDAKQFSASATLKQYAFDFRHSDPATGVDLEAPGQTLGNATNLTLQGGTTSVYKVTFTGTADIKHAALSLWAGEKYLIEKSSASTGNTLTDSDAWKFCYAYNAGECRTGSSAGDLYAAMPRLDVKTQCWQSQVNLRVPCAFSTTPVTGQMTQAKVSAADPAAVSQRVLGSLLMGPEQQYVYSNVIATPDASYLMFAGFLVNGYQTGLMMAKLPPFPIDSISRATFVPVIVSGKAGTSVIIQFGYEENGTASQFYCTPRAEICKVAASTINEATPFKFAAESLSGLAGNWSIAIPAISGRILYYRVVDNGSNGALRAIMVP